MLLYVNMVIGGYFVFGIDDKFVEYVCVEVVSVFYFFVLGIDGMCGMKSVLGG